MVVCPYSSVTRLLRSTRLPRLGHGLCRYSSTNSNGAQVGDRLFLTTDEDNGHLTKPLQEDGELHCRYGLIKHQDLLGKQSGDVLKTYRGRRLRIQSPTLTEYVALTPRLVTPVYGADANAIVSLLDLHLDPEQFDEGEPTFEILEVGTGHGSLTLHLARAIHAANVSPSSKDIQFIPDSIEHPSEVAQCKQNAVIHTLDISSRHSRLAKDIVRGFRRGIYANDVEFHVGTMDDWAASQIEARSRKGHQNAQTSFLSHIIIDVPDADAFVDLLPLLHQDGALIMFSPSVTQIGHIVETIRKKNLPLRLDRALELGPNLTGGKEWDIRPTQPKKFSKAARSSVDAEPAHEIAIDGDVESSSEQEMPLAVEATEEITVDDDSWKMICRPKVGLRVIGGGFVGMWRKTAPVIVRQNEVQETEQIL